jgi:hypothetical protein
VSVPAAATAAFPGSTAQPTTHAVTAPAPAPQHDQSDIEKNPYLRR